MTQFCIFMSHMIYFYLLGFYKIWRIFLSFRFFSFVCGWLFLTNCTNRLQLWVIYICALLLYLMWLIYVRHDSFMWDMTHVWFNHVRHDSFMWDMTRSCETWLIHVTDTLLGSKRCAIGLPSGGTPRSCATWLVHVRHDSLMWDMIGLYETCRIHAWHDFFRWRGWFMWDMTDS